MEKRTVLVVDDQEINRRLLNKILAEQYQVQTAADGSQALEILHAQGAEISAVLLDVVMPVMNGYEVLAAMNADPVLSQIPVIVSSQKDGDQDEVKALALGAQDFIAKPYKTDILLHRLANMIKLRENAAIINRVERDSLTGLYNKEFFLEKAAETLHDHPAAAYDLLRIDIDRFKLVNDTFGQAKGDALLRYAAETIKACGGKNLCGHFSADVFFVLREQSGEYSNAFFEPLVQKLNEFPISIDIKIHCGIYPIKPGSALSVDAMCDRAQMAAEKIKNKYDRCFGVYDDSLRQKLLEEQFITSCMQTALDERQFEVYYQPKYDLGSETIAGAEALIRWNHPEKGFLSPGAFIPLFEKNGFITQLDRYVWETACRDIRENIDRGFPPVAVSVNVSRADIYDPNLVDILLGLVAEYRIPLRYLHLEITETAYTDNPEQIIAVVSRLRSMGFLIEMDDFGSGYSSLNMLAEVPVDVLKLDMRFIQSETKKDSGKGILSFVISLAKWLNLAVVAEGVETGEQIAALRSMDCNYVQGFYYAKPMKKADFDALIQSSTVSEMVCTSSTVQHYVAEKAAEETPRSSRVMLIVDDIDINRAVLASVFEGEYTVVEKENGRTAWEYLQTHFAEVEVVMLDLLMPVMDGFQLLERIRGDERTKNMPVLITSQGNEGSEQRALEMRADDFVSKPYNPEIIRHRVHNVLASYRLEHLAPAAEPLPQTPKTPAEKTAAAERAAAELRPYFDIVRLVDPRETLVCETRKEHDSCGLHGCFSVWGKTSRCSNCTSLRAFETKSRLNKLEHSDAGLFFVISQYVPYGQDGAVLEMVTKMDDRYVNRILDSEMLYLRLDEVKQKLESDELTGIYNRRHIDRHLDAYLLSAQRSGRDLGIAMVDIDSFKAINDACGHLAGDEVIKSVAALLNGNIAISKGDFVARFGGDEFMVVCRDIPPEVFARRLTAVAALAAKCTVPNHPEVSVSVSIGCVNLSEFPDFDQTELIHRADMRLYKAKQTGSVVAAKD